MSLRNFGTRAVYRLLEASSLCSFLLSRTPGVLRILTYHGICPDEHQGEPWVPHCFVTAAQFEAQIAFLAGKMRPVPLISAIRRLKEDGGFAPRSVCITFDDGYANNLSLALPVLKKYGVPATLFLSTRWIEEGALFPFDRLRLIEFWRQRRPGARMGATAAPRYKKAPMETILTWLAETWPNYQHRLTIGQRRTLEPLSWRQVASLDPGLIDLGAHTHTHVILANESRKLRDQEIALSVDRIRARTGQDDILFAYPNGGWGDFDEADQRAVRSAGCVGAVSTIQGCNSPKTTDIYALKRFPVGLFHDRPAFLAEVSGLRTALTTKKTHSVRFNPETVYH